MNVLLWHVHGSWTTSFVQGKHTYLLPCVADRGPDGRGRARTWDWPSSAVECSPDELADAEIDVVIVQRGAELELARRWLGGRRPGLDVPLVWLEHNSPQGRIADMRHPAADHSATVLVHITHTNDLFWDAGRVPTVVIENGIPDPGHRYEGDVDACAVVMNEPRRRGRVVGADLLPRFARTAPLDLYGMGVSELAVSFGDEAPVTFDDDVPQALMHERIAHRRCYLHPFRWTSLGMALVEAMTLGMPVVGLATTDAPDVVSRDCGFISNDVDLLCSAIDRFRTDPELARELGTNARRRALDRFGLRRYLQDWDRLLEAL